MSYLRESKYRNSSEVAVFFLHKTKWKKYLMKVGYILKN